MLDDRTCRKRLRGMLEDFYKDVRKERLFEKEDTMSMKDFYAFLDKWIEKHFPFEMGEK